MGGGGNFLVPKNVVKGVSQTLTDVSDITCDIGDFRAHIFVPETTQEVAKSKTKLRTFHETSSNLGLPKSS